MELETLRHTTAHILAQALKRIYSDVKLAIGPPIKNGFYYDLEMEHKLTVADFPKIEKEMRNIIEQDFAIERSEISREEAASLMVGQTYKQELIKSIAEDVAISAYRQGEYIEICTGPHLPSTGEVPGDAFKLLSVAGAYWRGNENNVMLQRVYGTAFERAEHLTDYLTAIEEAKKRDHRKLGKELELFTIFDEGPGFPFFLPKGKTLRNELEAYWREIHVKCGYQEISTPVILSEDLWHQSGHWEHYKDNMYTTTIDDRAFAVKPMNCPGAILVYRNKPRSYRELPLKYAEMGLVHRHENSGNLHGLMRVRCFTQDDAHMFMMPEQLQNQVIEIIDLIDDVYNKMGFKYSVELSTRPENSMGSDAEWQRAIDNLKDALVEKGIDFKINEGDGAFYGPKIDFHLEDCLKRTWQCGTIQLDFQMPERFDLTYIGEDGKAHRPVMIHRVVLGSVERFIGILTENTMAKFPTWLSPTQVDILPISDKHREFAEKIAAELFASGVKIEVDHSNNTFGKKMRASMLRHTPYVIIIGDSEAANEVISVKNRDTGGQKIMPVSVFTEALLKEIRERSNELSIAKDAAPRGGSA